MTEFKGPAKTLTVAGESWELVKSATDASVSFPFERVDVKDYQVARIDDFNHMLIFTAFLRPTPQSMEMPQRLAFIGFSQRPLNAYEINPNQLRKMHVYKADIKNFANEFATAFLSQENKGHGAAEIKPFPDLNISGEKENGRTEQSDEA